RDGGRRRHFAEDGQDVILRDQLGDGVCRLFLLGLIVFAEDFDLASVDAAGSVDLVGSHHDAVVRRLAERGLSSSHRAVLADEDVAATGRRGGVPAVFLRRTAEQSERQHGEGNENQCVLAHRSPLQRVADCTAGNVHGKCDRRGSERGWQDRRGSEYTNLPRAYHLQGESTWQKESNWTSNPRRSSGSGRFKRLASARAKSTSSSRTRPCGN